MLSEIKTYLKQHQRANLSDLALHFRTSPEAMRGMLAVWVKKGKVTAFAAGQACGDCNTCDTSLAEIYEWNDNSAQSTVDSPALNDIKVVLRLAVSI